MTVSPESFPDPVADTTTGETEQTAVLAGGCFWCVEAVYRQLDGVTSVTNGYAGGTEKSADYQTVSSGRTDHAEAVEIRFDPKAISFGRLLKVFFSIAHDPTTKDRQGPDVGRQYRSVIFYVDADQRRIAEAYIKQLDAAKVLDRPIVTEVVPLDRFYPGEEYHQDYAARNPLQPYILFNARPKVDKVRKFYKDRVKSGR
jgi:peptide-methionine (S)-S-oxide reductase